MENKSKFKHPSTSKESAEEEERYVFNILTVNPMNLSNEPCVNNYVTCVFEFVFDNSL